MKNINVNDKNKMIEIIQNKVKIENENLSQALYKKNINSFFNNEKLTDEESLQHKIIYSSEELDFVINNYRIKFEDNELLENCIYLLNEFKQTKQTSKCNAVYNILNKYFTIANSYYDIGGRHLEWDGLKIINFVRFPRQLEEMIKEKVIKIKVDKQKQSIIDFKEKADKTDKEIIAELEL